MTIPEQGLASINSYYYENCPNLSPLAVLADIFNGETNSLSNVTIIISNPMDVTAEEVEALYQLATGSYGRLDYNDGVVTPSLTPGALVQGTINTNGMYQRQYDAITAAFPDLTVNVDKVYVEFEDAEVWRICCTNWGDYNEVVTTISNDTTTIVTTPVSMLNTTARRGTSTTVTRPTESGDTAGTVKVPVGITTAQCAAVSSLGTVFKNNNIVETYKDLVWFTRITSLNIMNLNSNSVKYMSFPLNVTNVFGEYVQRFPSCSDVYLQEGIETLGRMLFRGFPANLHIVAPSTVTQVLSETFYGLSSPVIFMLPTVPPYADSDIFNYASNYMIVVPDESLNDYKTSSYWSKYASSIYSMSDYGN
jgi:hypothetical protein